MLKRKPDERRDREQNMRPLLLSDDHLSNHVDLRGYMSDVEHQGDMNTCAANAVAGVLEYIVRRYMRRKYEVSRLFMYYNGRIRNDRPSQIRDYGVFAQDVIYGVREHGVCEEHIWPYEQRYVNRTPSKEAYDQAKHYSIVPLRIPPDIKSIETCLHHQYPVLVDIVLLEGAGRQIRANNGYLQMPDLKNDRINPFDIHTVLLVGYRRDKQYFIVRNSWGKDWGYGGYFYMPYEYLRHQRLFNPHDGLWTITHVIRRDKNVPPMRYLVSPNRAHKHH